MHNSLLERRSTAVKHWTIPTRLAILVAVLASLLATSVTSVHAAHSAAPMTLRITWFRWPPADYLQVVANLYTKSHPNVKIIVDEPPASQWYASAFNQFLTHHTTFDAAVGDSQWLGQGATSGYYLDLTSWIKKNLPVTHYVTSLMAAYGQYPQRVPGTTGGLDLVHGHFYGVPFESDALAWAYRKDWFADPANQKAFMARYHHPLRVPQSMDELVQIADFFTQPKKGIYGIAFHEANSYDASAEAFNEFLWTYGGDLWNPHTHQIEGYVNGPRALHALQILQHLAKDAPPGSGNYWFNEVNTAMNQGKIALGNNWFGFFPGIRDPKASTLGKTLARIDAKVGYFNNPPETYQGVTSHWASLGGQGLSISTFAPPAHQKAILAFVRWFQQPSIQLIWVKTGVGGTSNIETLSSPAFLNSSPYARLELPAYNMARDFWNVPQYAKMLTVLTQDVNLALTGSLSAKAALDDIAKKHTAILRGS
jgi:multiple sugar transport system substrate-binding protein